jgi:hypothetical protein
MHDATHFVSGGGRNGGETMGTIEATFKRAEIIPSICNIPRNVPATIAHRSMFS